MIAAYRTGEASVVAPFDYSRLIIAGGLGYAVFGEIPDGWTLAGASVIVAATLYIARREAIPAGTTATRAPAIGQPSSR